MATRLLARSLLTAKSPLSSAFSHSVNPNSWSALVSRLHPIVAAASASYFRRLISTTRAFSTEHTASDPNLNWSNRPPEETYMLAGCDFEHWLVIVDRPEDDPPRDEIIDRYIKMLATVVGSEEEARMRMYSVSTRHYYAFSAVIPEEVSYRLKELPNVCWVLPDSYLDVKNKDYGGEPFINGQAVPYDPKYHKEWLKNNDGANGRNMRNDGPRNLEQRTELEGQNSGGNPEGPGGNYNGGPPPTDNGGGGMPPNNPGNYQRPPPNNPSIFESIFEQGPGPNSGASPYQPGPGPNHGGFPAGIPGPYPGGFTDGPNQNLYANVGGESPYQNQNYPGPNSGYGPGPTENNFAPNLGSDPGQYQNAYGPNARNPSHGQNIPGSDFPFSSNY